MSFVGAIIAATVITSAATSAYGAKQGRKRAREQRENQNLRELIEGAAPNISNVEEIMAEAIGKENEQLLADSLSQMDYQTQVAQEGADFAAETQMDQRLQQMVEQGLPPEFLEQQGAGAMARGGPVGTPNDAYYFDVGNIMNMMTDENPQIQNVGMQLADQMTANPGMSMIPATRDQIQGMAYGGQVEPKKYDKGGVLEPQGTLTTSGYAPNTPSVTEYKDPSEVDPQIREYLELQNSLSGLGTELLHTLTTPETPIEQSINTIRGLFSNWNESPDLQGTIFNSTDAARQRMLDRQELSQEERRDLYFQDMEDAQDKQGREENLRAFIEMQRDKRRATGGPVQPSRYAYGDVVESNGNGLGLEELLRQILPADKDQMSVDKYDPEGNLIERSITYSSSEEGDPLVSDARKTADFHQEIMNFQIEQEASPESLASQSQATPRDRLRSRSRALGPASRRMETLKRKLRKEVELRAKEEGSALMDRTLSDADLRRVLPTRFQ